MASNPTTSGQITASDMLAVAKVNWDELAARAGFKDGATTKAYYEPLLLPRDRAAETTETQQSSRGNDATSMRVETETDDSYMTRYLFDLDPTGKGVGPERSTANRHRGQQVR
ncbi:hypothetical protein GGR57DRAFT_509541 [Xylariaceae sp. FL1272]|nr:hypothetical protein GGR57DRAFT_509541 [Xylariaceae sp. FL1272]